MPFFGMFYMLKLGSENTSWICLAGPYYISSMIICTERVKFYKNMILYDANHLAKCHIDEHSIV